MLTIGSYNPRNLKAELYNDENDTWELLSDYPYSGKESVFYQTTKNFLESNPLLTRIIDCSCEDSNGIHYSISIHHNGAFYVFGGTYNLRNIARLDGVSQRWSLAGKLNSDRLRHNVIFDGTYFLVVGGEGSKKTENCVLDETVITCTEQDSDPISDYVEYPALFLTADDYGDDC